MAIQHERFRGIGYAADPGMPERLAGCGVMRNDVAIAISSENKTASGSEHSTSAAGAGDIRMAPGDGSCLVIDRGQKIAGGTQGDLFMSAKAHGAARVEIGQIEDGMCVGFGCVEKAGVRIEGRRLP